METETKESIFLDDNGEQWVRTYDIGYVDEDGCIFIVDRIKNMIIRSDGFKVFPLTIEKYILMHPAVETCKVIGIQDPNFNKGMLPKAFIVLKRSIKDSTDKILNEIKELCITNLPEYQIPIDYVIREELPLTGIGKIDVKALEENSNNN